MIRVDGRMEAACFRSPCHVIFLILHVPIDNTFISMHRSTCRRWDRIRGFSSTWWLWYVFSSIITVALAIRCSCSTGQSRYWIIWGCFGSDSFPSPLAVSSICCGSRNQVILCCLLHCMRYGGDLASCHLAQGCSHC